MNRVLKSPLSPDSIAGGLKLNDKTNKTQLSDKLKPYTKRQNATKQQLKQLLTLPNADQIIPVSRIKHCSQCLLFNQYHQINKTKLAYAQFCEVHLICSQCARRRAMKYAQEIKNSAQKTQFQFLQLITLTVRNSHDIEEVLSRLWKYLTILINRFKRQNVKDSITKQFKGGAWFVEITYNKLTGYHPHVHGLISSTKRIYTHEVRSEWESISKGDSFMCDSTPIKFNNEQHLWNSILEVCKYTLKNTELPPEQMLEVYQALKGKRLIRRFGTFKGKAINLNPDLIDYENEPFYQFIYNYLNGQYIQDSESGYHYKNAEDYRLNRKSYKIKKALNND